MIRITEQPEDNFSRFRTEQRSLTNEASFGLPPFSNIPHELVQNLRPLMILQILGKSMSQYQDLQYDVFLSHNSKDKPMVRELKRRLSGRGLTVWLDEDELRPGMPWQQLLEAGIRASKSVAVLVGKDGLGPWEDEE